MKDTSLVIQYELKLELVSYINYNHIFLGFIKTLKLL